MSWWFRTCITTTTMGVTYACWNWTNSGFLTFSCWQLGLVICIRYCWCSAAFLQALMNIPRGNIISDWEHWPAAWASQVVLVVKNLPANAGDKRDVGSIPGSGRSPGGGHGNSLQYSCLENPMDRGAWRDTIHRVAKSRTWLKREHAYTLLMNEEFMAIITCESESVSHSVVSDSLRPHGL